MSTTPAPPPRISPPASSGSGAGVGGGRHFVRERYVASQHSGPGGAGAGNAASSNRRGSHGSPTRRRGSNNKNRRLSASTASSNSITSLRSPNGTQRLRKSKKLASPKGGDKLNAPGRNANNGKKPASTGAPSPTAAGAPQEQPTDNAVPRGIQESMVDSASPVLHSTRSTHGKNGKGGAGGPPQYADRMKRKVDALSEMNSRGAGLGGSKKSGGGALQPEGQVSPSPSQERKQSMPAWPQFRPTGAFGESETPPSAAPAVSMVPTEDRFLRTSVLISVENNLENKRPGDVRTHMQLRRPTIMSDVSDSSSSASSD